MKITHVTIKNFRALKHIDCSLNQFSVIIGENDSGKTSFLYALKAFFEKKVASEKDWHNHDTKEDIKIVLTFTDLPPELNEGLLQSKDKIQIECVFKRGKDDSEDTKIPAPTYHAIVHEIRHKMPKDDLAYFSDDNFIFLPVVRSVNEQFGMQKTAILGKTLRKYMKMTDNDEMTQASETIQRILKGSIKEIEDGIGELMGKQMNNSSIKFSFGEIKIDPIDDVKVSPTLSDSTFNDIPLVNRGAGTQNNAIFALLRHIRKLNKKIKREFIFLLEEPENSLHPKAQRNLFSVIQDLSEDAQVLVTTHSPVFIDRTRYESNILFSIKKEGTVAKTFSEDALPEIREELGVRVSDVLLKGGGNGALLVEGPTEEDVMPVFMEMMEASKFATGTTIIKTGGKRVKKIEAVVNLLNCYEINCIVMLDKDGQESAKILKDEMDAGELPNLKEIICLEKGDIEDYYPRDVIVQVMRDEYKVTISESDVCEGSSVDQLENIFNQKAKVKFVKTRFGWHCANLMRKKGVDVPDEIKGIINKVVDMGS